MLDNTLAVLNKIKNDVKRVCSISDVIVQLFFICLYAFSIFSNVNNPIRLTIFSLLFGLSFVYFVFHFINILIKSQRFKNTQKKFKRLVTYLKLFIQAFTIGFTSYEIVRFGASDLTKMLTICTSVCFLLHVALEIIKVVIENYTNLLIVAIKEDAKPLATPIKAVSGAFKNAFSVVSNPKEILLKAVNKPLGFIAGKISGKNEQKESAITSSQSQSEQQIESQVKKNKDKTKSKLLKITNRYKEEKQQQKTVVQNEEKYQKQQQVAVQFEKAKSNLATIFNKFKKNSNPDDLQSESNEHLSQEVDEN